MRAAIYLRSSKDRSDVSIDAQRRELNDLAKSKNLLIIEEFADAVESGKDDNRPGFQSLLSRLKSKERKWDHLLALDTSRIARNQYLAHALHFECEKRAIKVLYAKMPETGSVVDVVIRSVMQAFDQLHSLMSKEKGLAGMAENVKQGYRAGGRAPIGYQLNAIDTGAIRDGESVTKSKLILSAEAPQIGAFLKMRASGLARHRARDESGLKDISHTSLVGIEWNALTYAGHTVWNVHNERLSSGGYRGGIKRRPRADWVIQHDTHPPLITTDEAESILNALENSSYSKGRRTSGDYLFTGILKNSAGVPWHGADGIYYRCGKGKRVSRNEIESALVRQITSELSSGAFISALTRESRKSAQPLPESDIKPLRDQVSVITAKIARLADIAVEAESPRPWLEQIDKLEKQRNELVAQLDQSEAEQRSASILMAISESDVAKILKGFTDQLDMQNREALKDFISGVVEKIVMDDSPVFTCSIHYRINTGDSVASPRLRDTIPALRIMLRYRFG